MSHLILGLTLLLAAGPGGSLTITTQSGPIASPITARVTVPLGKGERVEFPEKPPLADGAELLSVNPGAPLEGRDGSGAQILEYVFMAYKVGDGVLPAVEYTVIGEDGAREKRSAGPASFTIVSVRTDPKTADKPVEIRPLLPMSFDWGRYLIPALALLAAAIIGALIWRRISRLKRATGGELLPPLIPAHVTALASLEKLREDDLFSHGEGRRHFFQVSEIMRRYVEGRYGAPALERTTDEIEMVFDQRFERKEKRDPLLCLLREMDMVKFAKREANREDGLAAIGRARAWVEATKPAEALLREAK